MMFIRAATIALCLPLYALAAEWVKVPTPDQNVHYYDRTKLTLEGFAITYWRRVEFRVPQPSKSGAASSAMYRERVDCKSHTQRTLGYLLYSRDGTIIENVHKPDAEAEPIIPETVGDRYEKLMCSLVDRLAEPRTAGAASAAPTPEQIRQEIDWLEARLRILRDQLQELPKADTVPAEAGMR
jgi:hypothetical protein